MMTGDKIETAVNVGYACKLIEKHAELVVLEDQSKDIIKSELEKSL